MKPDVMLLTYRTGFADRQFYADWWNSCDWLEFSREWNKPV
jgi:sterol O-acyltransferase